MLLQTLKKNKQQFLYTTYRMGRGSWGSYKAFAVIGFILSDAEWAVEKATYANSVVYITFLLY